MPSDVIDKAFVQEAMIEAGCSQEEQNKKMRDHVKACHPSFQTNIDMI